MSTTYRYALLVPVKDVGEAKTRLGAVGDERRVALMAAFARDALAAARRSPGVEVYVVGDAKAAADAGVAVLPDEGEGSLNRALARAAARVASPTRGIAVLLADLPCLASADLERALDLATAAGGRAYVADAAGTGTTLLVAAPGIALEPRFGIGSAQAHADSGATALLDPLPTLRLDVDTTDDLAAALELGVGAHTARATAGLA